MRPGAHFKMHYALFDKPIWLQSTPEQKTILVTLIGMANFKPKEWEWMGEKFVCDPGQFVTSATSIIKKAGKGISRQNVRSAILRFEKLGFLTIKSTNTGMLITIVNWTTYQSNGASPNQEDNQDPTKTQPRGNQEVTTREEGKKERRNKPPTPFDDILVLFGNKLPMLSVPVLDEALRAQIRVRWNEHPDIEWWIKYFDIVLQSPWLIGNGSDWKATLPWLMGPKNMSKVLNGQYLKTVKTESKSISQSDWF